MEDTRDTRLVLFRPAKCQSLQEQKQYDDLVAQKLELLLKAIGAFTPSPLVRSEFRDSICRVFNKFSQAGGEKHYATDLSLCDVKHHCNGRKIFGLNSIEYKLYDDRGLYEALDSFLSRIYASETKENAWKGKFGKFIQKFDSILTKTKDELFSPVLNEVIERVTDEFGGRIGIDDGKNIAERQKEGLAINTFIESLKKELFKRSKGISLLEAYDEMLVLVRAKVFREDKIKALQAARTRLDPESKKSKLCNPYSPEILAELKILRELQYNFNDKMKIAELQSELAYTKARRLQLTRVIRDIRGTVSNLVAGQLSGTLACDGKVYSAHEMQAIQDLEAYVSKVIEETITGDLQQIIEEEDRATYESSLEFSLHDQVSKLERQAQQFEGEEKKLHALLKTYEQRIITTEQAMHDKNEADKKLLLDTLDRERKEHKERDAKRKQKIAEQAELIESLKEALRAQQKETNTLRDQVESVSEGPTRRRQKFNYDASISPGGSSMSISDEDPLVCISAMSDGEDIDLAEEGASETSPNQSPQKPSAVAPRSRPSRGTRLQFNDDDTGEETEKLSTSAPNSRDQVSVRAALEMRRRSDEKLTATATNAPVKGFDSPPRLNSLVNGGDGQD